jgi:monoterpene epsilon-lactone hydrolase
MRMIERITKRVIKRSLLALAIISLPLLYSSSFAAEGDWTIGARVLPAPAAASDSLRNTLASIPAPDVVARSQPLGTSVLAAMGAPQSLDLEALGQSAGVSITRDTIAGVKVYHVTPDRIAPEHENHLFIHVHGGGYVLGGGDASVTEVVTVAATSGIRALSIDYRMPPQSPSPAAVDDTIAVYQEVLKSRQANQLAIGGTSAGGGLSFAAVHQMKSLNIPLPGAIFAGTPWADLTKTSDTLYSHEGIDRVLVSYDGLLKSAALLYADGTDLKDPLISPLYGDFNGFPPTILISGTRDMLLSDTVRSHRKLRDAGVVADLHVFEGLSHAGYLMAPDSPESVSTFAELSAFLKTHLK